MTKNTRMQILYLALQRRNW